MDPASTPAARREAEGFAAGEAMARAWDLVAVGVLGLDAAGVVRYANPAAAELLGDIVGQPVTGVLAPGEPFPGRSGAEFDLATTRVQRVTATSGGGSAPRLFDVNLTRVTPAGEDGAPAVAVVATVRAANTNQLASWSDLAAGLADALARVGSEQPAAVLLQALGQRLGFEVTALWGLAPNRRLTLREVWSDPVSDPNGTLRAARSGVFGPVTLPYHVLESAQPLWVASLAADPRFADGPAARAGLASAVVLPVHRGLVLVGVIELFATRPRVEHPELVELMRAVSWPVGELLAALEDSAERERLLRELATARQRQDFLLRASRVVADVADYPTALQRLAEVAVPTLGDLCLIDILDEHGVLTRAVAHHHDPSKTDLVRELHDRYAPDPAGQHPSVEVLHERRSRWSRDMDDEFLRATTRDEHHYQLVKALGFTSYVSVPLLAADQSLLGTLTLVSAGSGRRFEETDLAWAEQLATQVASVLNRTHRYERERDISHAFQRSLLPAALPSIPGLEIAARYVPAARDTQVGGDWYDIVTDPGTAAAANDGWVALVVGDVEGHDMHAATVMASLRHALNAILGEQPGTAAVVPAGRHVAADHVSEVSPAVALARLNDYHRRIGHDRLATVLIAVVDHRRGRLRVASAGHPPPALRTADGTVLLPAKPAPPIGVGWPEITTLDRPLTPGTLLLFTDGLVEQTRAPLDVRLAALIDSLAGAPTGAEAVADHVLGAMLTDTDHVDDVVVLAADIP